MGVWIETYRPHWHLLLFTSHPVWVCGLKLAALGKSWLWKASHTLYGCVD